MSQVSADQNLLFGLLALQTGLINQGALFAAFSAWTRDKVRSMSEILVAQGDLDTPRRDLLAGLVAEHVKLHGDDAQQSLAAIEAGQSTREKLTQLTDSDLASSIAVVGSKHRPAKSPAAYPSSGPRTPSTEAQQAEIHGMFAEGGSSLGDAAPAHATFSVGTSSSSGERFRVLRPYAKGGLGAVFVALDTELHREVALKQINDQHADDLASRRRFLVEAEIAGGLEHPGIVPVYGVGTYANGRPFYAMRFVRGDTLKDAVTRFHADPSLKRDPGRRKLELQKLLRRFLDVCNAIEYAHSRGVLHRDLKPGNIIVGKHGETLVVDWGLAKSVGRDHHDVPQSERTLIPSSAGDSSETLPGSAMGTPAFMSPEQAKGDLSRLGPRSDVYSLGATLYTVLTGTPPFDAGVLDAVLDAVWRGDFRRPRSVDRSIDPALEAVCLKAMARSPEDRYATSRSLGDDIERWIADEPVSAFHEPLIRRMRRWGRRNRTAVASAAVAILAALIGTAAVLAEKTQANTDLRIANGLLSVANARERKNNADLTASNDRERARFDLAMQAIKLFHGDVAEDLLLKERQFEDLRTKLLRGAADFYAKLERLLKVQTDRSSRIELGRAYFELGELTANIGNKPEALALHRKSLTARREEAGQLDAEPDSLLDLAQSLLAVGYLLSETGDTARAQSAFNEARELADRLVASATAPDDARDTLGRIESAIGSLQALAGDTSAALQSYRRALAIQEKLADSAPADIQFQSDLADTHTSIGSARMVTGDLPAALECHRRALAIRQKLAAKNAADTGIQFNLAASHVYIGNVLSEAGDITAALESYRKGLAIHENLAGSNPAVTQFQNDFAGSLYGIGELLWKHGDPIAALESCRRTAKIQTKLAESNPTVANFRHDLAWTLEVISRVQVQTGDHSGALRSLREALAIRESLASSNPTVTEFQSTVASTQSTIAGVQLSTGDLSNALALYRRAAASQTKLAAANPSITHLQGDLAWSLDGIGHILRAKAMPPAQRNLIAVLSRSAKIRPNRTPLSRPCKPPWPPATTASPACGSRPVIPRAPSNRMTVPWQSSRSSRTLTHPTPSSKAICFRARTASASLWRPRATRPARSSCSAASWSSSRIWPPPTPPFRTSTCACRRASPISGTHSRRPARPMNRGCGTTVPSPSARHSYSRIRRPRLTKVIWPTASPSSRRCSRPWATPRSPSPTCAARFRSGRACRTPPPKISWAWQERTPVLPLSRVPPILRSRRPQDRPRLEKPWTA